MTDSEAARIVRAVLCRGLSVEQSDHVTRAMIATAANPGNDVLREGDRPQGLFLLVKGTVEVLKEADGADEVIATLDAPTVLGEMSLILSREASATVRAKTPCEFRLLTRVQFERLIGEDSLGAYKIVLAIAEVMARRLYRMDEKILELRAQREQPRPVEELSEFKRKLFSEWSV
jgi:CRP/FNR family transcriptional regulator